MLLYDVSFLYYCVLGKKQNKRSEETKDVLNTHLLKMVKKKKIGVEISGFEPEASRMQSERSTTELYPHVANIMRIMQFIRIPRKRHRWLVFSHVMMQRTYAHAQETGAGLTAAASAAAANLLQQHSCIFKKELNCSRSES